MPSPFGAPSPATIAAVISYAEAHSLTSHPPAESAAIITRAILSALDRRRCIEEASAGQSSVPYLQSRERAAYIDAAQVAAVAAAPPPSPLRTVKFAATLLTAVAPSEGAAASILRGIFTHAAFAALSAAAPAAWADARWSL